MFKIDGLSGIVPPLVTPLTDKRDVDEAGLRRLIEYVIDGGVHAVFVMGSTGEFAAFSREERRCITELVVDAVSDRVPVLAGVSDSGTELAVRNTKDAETVGADAVVATLPYYFPTHTEQVVLDHFRRLAEATSLPLILYDIPQFVKSTLDVETVARLAEEGKAFGIKDSSADLAHLQSLLFRLSGMPGFRIYQGNEFELAAGLLMGAQGGIVGIANLAPQLCVQLYEAASSGRVNEARELQRRLTALGGIFSAGESSIGSLKSALSMLGICGPVTTMPIPEASDGSRNRIQEIVKASGLTIPQ